MKYLRKYTSVNKFKDELTNAILPQYSLIEENGKKYFGKKGFEKDILTINESGSATTLFAEGGVSGKIQISIDGTVVGTEKGINNAIDVVNSGNDGQYTLTLMENTNVEWDYEHSMAGTNSVFKSLNAGKKIILDLNGYSLLVNGMPSIIKGNADVTIFLKDNGSTNYANLSTVKDTPIKYERTFASSVRAGNYQALFLPFAVENRSRFNYLIRKITYVAITSYAVISIDDFEDNKLDAYTPYAVKSSVGTIEINQVGDLLPYKVMKPMNIGEGEECFTIKGSLLATDNSIPSGAGLQSAYWVFTNGGTFTWAAGPSNQRPYHWVIRPPKGYVITNDNKNLVIA